MPFGHHANRTTIVQPVVVGGPACAPPIVHGPPVVEHVMPVVHETAPIVSETVVHETMPVPPVMHGGVTRTTTTVTTTEY